MRMRRIDDGGHAVVRFVGAVGTRQICHRRASPVLALGIRLPVRLDGQQTGHRFLSARNDEPFTSFDGRQQHGRVLLEFFYGGPSHTDEKSLQPSQELAWRRHFEPHGLSSTRRSLSFEATIVAPLAKAPARKGVRVENDVHRRRPRFSARYSAMASCTISSSLRVCRRVSEPAHAITFFNSSSVGSGMGVV